MDDRLSDLEAEYCPPIDPALLSAILSDFDLTDEANVQSARAILDSLKDSALLEEAAGFDASGTGGLEGGFSSEERAESDPGTSTSFSKETDVSAVSEQPFILARSSGLDDSAPGSSDLASIEHLDEETKILLLQDVLGERVNRYTIQHTLTKTSGNWSKALEELLNLIYHDEAAADSDSNSGLFNAKGVNGFSSEETPTSHGSGRKGRAKNRRPKAGLERRSSSLSELIIPQYTRLNISDTDSTTKPRNALSAASSRSTSTVSLPNGGRKDAYDLARRAAFTQASAARRKAKFDHLMSGAAAYYSQTSREYATLSHNASAREADDLAAAQSSSTQVDLHGIDVKNAVRIAEEYVEAWWSGLGESRVNGRVGAEARQSGFRIVVGLGRHSEGGRSKLGPAVSKMLRERGWRAEPVSGAIVVYGRARM